MAARSASVLACAVLVLSSGAAFAQVGNNQITILQQGDGNRLTVNQANATNSRVGGLVVGPNVVQITGLQVLGTTPQTESIRQEDGTFLTREVIGATGLTTATADTSTTSSARQIGPGNVANVNISGDGGFVGLLQSNPSTSLSGGLTSAGINEANVRLTGGGTALVGQEGSGNRADLSVSNGAFGSILQAGSNNSIGLNVAGQGVSGSLSQTGNGNVTGLSVTGAQGTSVSYSLFGNGVQSFDTTQGVDVVTNAASVTITQTAFGGQ